MKSKLNLKNKLSKLLFSINHSQVSYLVQFRGYLVVTVTSAILKQWWCFPYTSIVLIEWETLSQFSAAAVAHHGPKEREEGKERKEGVGGS